MLCVLLYMWFSETHIHHHVIEQHSRPVRRVRKVVLDSETEEILSPKVHEKKRQKDKVAPMGVDDTAQSTLDYIGDSLDIQYNVVGNDGGRFHVDLVLTNAGKRMIPACCWAIYLYHMKYDVV